MSNRNAGDVSLRFSVENAEVVRQALGALGKDGAAALRQFDAAAKPVPRNVQILSEAMAQARIQGHAWASSLGPVGAVLTSISPAGLVAAAGIGATVLAMKAGVDWANRFGTEMVALRNAAQTLDLTVTQLQALNDAGSEFAVTEEKMQTALQRFVSQMDEFKRAQGPMFEFLERTNPALARQMLGAQNTAQAIDMLSRAYQNLSTQQQSALSRVAFGRTGFDVGLVIQGLDSKGGMAALEASFRKTGDAIDEAMIQRIVKLKTEIDDMSGDASRNIASIFAEPVLEQQKRFVEAFLELSRLAKNFELSKDAKSYLSTIASQAVSAIPGGGLLTLFNRGASYLADRGRDRPPPDVYPDESTRGMGVARFPSLPPAEADQIRISAEALYNIEKKRLELLGSAITPMETYRLKQLELAAADEKSGVSADIRNRALAALALSQGQAAVAARQRLGLLTEEEALQQGLRQLQADRANGYITSDEEMAAAERVLRKEVQETHEALRVRLADYPQLTRAIIGASDQAKQLDGQIVRGVDSIADGLTDAAMGTKTLQQAFSDMASSIVRDLLRIQARNVLLQASGGLMSSFGGNGGGLMGSTFGGGTGFLHTPGGFSGAFPMPAANGAYFDKVHGFFANGGAFTNCIVNGATPFAFSNGGRFGLGVMGEKTEEAVMPLRRGAGGRLGIDASGVGGGKVEINIVNQSSAEVQGSPRRSAGRNGGERIDVMLKDAVRSVVRDDLASNGEISRSIGDRFGLDSTRGMR